MITMINNYRNEQWGMVPPSLRGFSKFFFLDDQMSAPNVFSGFSFIPRTYFDTTLETTSCYGHEIRLHKGLVRNYQGGRGGGNFAFGFGNEVTYPCSLS